MTIDHYRHLLRCVLENPEDDAPRLVLADWLMENGQPERGEFIQCQIEIASVRHGLDECYMMDLSHCDPQRAGLSRKLDSLVKRERVLLGTMLDTSTSKNRMETKASFLWIQEAFGRLSLITNHDWRRGFIDSFRMPVDQFISNAKQIFSCQPVTHVELTGFELSPLPSVGVLDRWRWMCWRTNPHARGSACELPLCFFLRIGTNDPGYLDSFDQPGNGYSYRDFDTKENAMRAVRRALVNFGRHSAGLEDLP